MSERRSGTLIKLTKHNVPKLEFKLIYAFVFPVNTLVPHHQGPRGDKGEQVTI